jgi:LPS-assembly lipoprotein
MTRHSAPIACWSRTLAVLALSAWLAGCGFYLKGSRPLPEGLGDVNVEFDNRFGVEKPPLVKALERRLAARPDTGDDQPFASRLIIRSVKTEQGVLSVSPVDGTAAEYELMSTAHFDFRHKGGVVLSDSQVGARRMYSLDNTERLAAEAEREILVEAMQEEMADLILLKIENELRLKVRYQNAQAEG